MDWDDALAAIRTHVETAWSAGALADVPLHWENEAFDGPTPETYVEICVEGIYADKTIYGSVGKRRSIESGIVYIHAFYPTLAGTAGATRAVRLMTQLLELQAIGTDGAIRLDGGDPPTPVQHSTGAVPTGQPEGNYYRVSGAVPFIVIGTR